MKDHEIRRVEANGIDFAYIEQGDAGAPLALCLHGFPDHAYSYEGLMNELAGAGYHAVAPWLRGYAPTGLAPDGRYQTAASGLDALALADHFAGDGRAVTIGHDWGAAAAYAACAHRPERFSKLVAMSVPHTAAMVSKFLFDPAAIKSAFHVFFFQLPGIPEASIAANDFAFIDFLWREWSPMTEPDPVHMRKLKETLASPGTAEAAINYYRSMFNPSHQAPELTGVQTGSLGPINVPTLYLHGVHDGALIPDLASLDELKPLFPAGLEFELVEGAGHFMLHDRPREVNARIIRFLAGR
jgi:pimeloyl-ACP methyl ester carboxylesterase